MYIYKSMLSKAFEICHKSKCKTFSYDHIHTVKRNAFGPPMLNLEVRDHHRHKSHCLVKKFDMIGLNHKHHQMVGNRKHIMFFKWHICQCIVV